MRLLSAFLVAMTLAGCDVSGQKRTATDDQGCKWSIEVFYKRNGTLSKGAQLAYVMTDSDGKPLCGAGEQK